MSAVEKFEHEKNSNIFILHDVLKQIQLPTRSTDIVLNSEYLLETVPTYTTFVQSFSAPSKHSRRLKYKTDLEVSDPVQWQFPKQKYFTPKRCRWNEYFPTSIDKPYVIKYYVRNEYKKNFFLSLLCQYASRNL